MAKRLVLAVAMVMACTAVLAGDYKVKQGDSLWRIAKAHYGQGSKWRTIYNANRATIANPNKLYAGQILQVPTTKPVGKHSAPQGYTYWKTIQGARVTAYDPARCCCGRHANGKTATGTNAWATNGCSVYKVAIPYGTIVNIPGIGYRVADDTGPAMRRSWVKYSRYHIDIRFKYHWQAKRWGNKKLTVILYKKVGNG